MVRQLKVHFPGAEFVLHFHNNRGTAMANLLSALMTGVTTFDTALGGIGGCPYVPRYPVTRAKFSRFMEIIEKMKVPG